MSAADLFLGAGVLLTAPSPSDGGELNSVTVSPGLPGFFAAFVLAVLVVLLGISMTRHTRRIQAQARVKERMEAEERAEAEGAAKQSTADDTADAAESADGADGADGPAAGPIESADGEDGAPDGDERR